MSNINEKGELCCKYPDCDCDISTSMDEIDLEKMKNNTWVYVRLCDEYVQVEILGVNGRDFLVKKETGEIMVLDQSNVYLPLNYLYPPVTHFPD